MNFENKGKWLKEAQDKMAARDTMEDPDFLDGDDKVLTFEEELDIEDNDIEEEPAQKNEDFYKYIDDVPTEEIAKALKELGIKEPYATQKAKIADKLAKRFGLRRVPTPIEMTSILDALPYFKDESAQKNEAKSERAYDINFDNMGGGFTVEKVSITNGYGIELSGYSSNTSKKLTYVHPTLSNDRGKSQDEIEKNYDALNAKRTAIAKDLKPLADKFDKDIEAVFAKHGFKKA